MDELGWTHDDEDEPDLDRQIALIGGLSLEAIVAGLAILLLLTRLLR